jgi:hypothetical protein
MARCLVKHRDKFTVIIIIVIIIIIIMTVIYMQHDKNYVKYIIEINFCGPPLPLFHIRL